eukprot:TRINITY_DN16942_c0_g1_i1.p1 TRINITY_DN16942_c0_g1~~TRINITY_DN16942_c0_g1_i1.p1  ORF type:complete len:759 (+),score=88.43 TRINITY_DN16942_c0_g1_i1:108-2384(+)
MAPGEVKTEPADEPSTQLATDTQPAVPQTQPAESSTQPVSSTQAVKAEPREASPRTTRTKTKTSGKKSTEKVKRSRDADSDDDDDDSTSSGDDYISCPLSKIVAVEAELQKQAKVFHGCKPNLKKVDTPLNGPLRNFFSDIKLSSNSLGSSTETLSPLTRISTPITGTRPTPPTSFLATGLPFINKVCWCPTIFGDASEDGKSYEKPYRYLAVQGTRVPIEIVIGCTDTGRFFEEGHTEVMRKECALFSRVIQIWKIGAAPPPSADFCPEEFANISDSPATLELTLPRTGSEDDDLWQPRDIQWWGKDLEEANTAILLGRFTPASAELNRIGIIAVVTSHGHVAVYPVPRQEPGSHHKIVPHVWCQDSTRSPFTCVTWRVRKGEISLYCGMANGDVSCAYLTTSETGPVLVITSHIRIQCSSGIVKELAILPTWYTESEECLEYDSDDSCSDFNHKMPVHNWKTTCKDRLGKFRVQAPDKTGVHKTDLLVIRCFSDKRIRLIDLTQAALGHVHPTQCLYKGKGLPTSFVTLSYGTVLVGLDDGTIHVFGRDDPLSFAIKHSCEIQSGIQSMSYASDERRRKVVNHKRRLKLSGVTGKAFVRPKTDSLVAYVTTNGTVSLLRWAKQVLMFGHSKRTCKTCHFPLKSSWDLACCACYSKGPANRSVSRSALTFAEDTPLLIVKDVSWSLPKTADTRPCISVSVATSVTEDHVEEHRTATGTLDGLVNQSNLHSVELAPGGVVSHLLATSCPGGLIVVTPL